MSLALNEVALSMRRVGGQLRVYPRLLRDGSMLPRIALAIDYYESLLGQERQQLEPDMLVELFGDPRLARGLAAALGSSYRFRPRRIDEVVGRTGAGRLKRAGLPSSPSLRLWLYDQLNAAHAGFLPAHQRSAVWPRLEGQLRLRAGQLKQLLYLDRPEHLRLERLGPRPRPVDVAAQYNFQVIECLLRHAELVELAVGSARTEQVEGAVALCAAQQVEAVFDASSGRLRLLGRQDALGSWARHGRHLTRGLLDVLDHARGLVAEGEARVKVRGRSGTLRLGTDVLDLLGGAAQPGGDWEPDGLAPVLRSCAATLRGWGWRVRLQPEARVRVDGVLLPDLLVHNGPDGPPCLVLAVRGGHHARRLAAVVRGGPRAERLLLVGREADLTDLRSIGAELLPLSPEAQPSRIQLARMLREHLQAEAAEAA